MAPALPIEYSQFLLGVGTSNSRGGIPAIQLINNKINIHREYNNYSTAWAGTVTYIFITI